MDKDRFKDLREKRGLKQIDLVEILHVNRHSISSYELGHSQPSHETLVVIANYFDVSVDYLLGRCKDYYPTPEGEQYLRLPFGLSSSDKEMLATLADFLSKRGKS